MKGFNKNGKFYNFKRSFDITKQPLKIDYNAPHHIAPIMSYLFKCNLPLELEKEDAQPMQRRRIRVDSNPQF
ncbi:hypothetical protein GW915_07370 [bacterium]|nr:hypothetical protein [bacterium]